MKTLFIDKPVNYDGTQLHSLFAYLNFNILGPSAVCFRGSCNVEFSEMVDGEDLLDRSKICGSDMLHFIVEIFDEKLITGVFLQRLFASIVQNEIYFRKNIYLSREGDDLYLDKNCEKKKLSISIATRSPNSVLIHFAVNCKNTGTPVATCALEDLNIDPTELGKSILDKFQKEYESIQTATYKVKSVK